VIRIPSHDPHYRIFRLAKLLLTGNAPTPGNRKPSPAQQPRGLSSGSIDRTERARLRPNWKNGNDYQTRLEHYQQMLRELKSGHPRFARRSLLLVFEGSDAAGKGAQSAA